MPPYTIEGKGKSRILLLQGAQAHRFKFSQIIGEKLEPVHFKRAGGKLIAVVSDCVLVYKVPNAHKFHKEFMQHNARAMWMGMQSQPDRLLENMLEFEETL